jgi:CIC family chloride channel protein
MHSPPASESKLIANTAPSRSAEERRVNLLILCGLALVIGVMTGFGAVVFRALIALVHNASYSGRLSFVYDANIMEGPSRFGDLVLFSPIIGGLIVVYIVRTFAPEARGHGVPEVMDAVFYKHGNIRGCSPSGPLRQIEGLHEGRISGSS